MKKDECRCVYCGKIYNCTKEQEALEKQRNESENVTVEDFLPVCDDCYETAIERIYGSIKTPIRY